MIQESLGEEWQCDPKPLTRIEFRIGRELLRAMKINTMSDLLECEKALFQYCCKKWFRVIDGPRKKGHTHEQESSPEWKLVQEAFEKWFPGVQGHQREVKRRYGDEIKCEPEHLEKQAVGCLSTLLAMTEGVDIDLDKVKTKLYEIVRAYAEKILAVASDRAAKLGICGGQAKRIDPSHASE